MQQIFNLIYPVGSLYFSTVLDTVAKVQAAFGGTWEKLPDGYAIWTAASGAGNTIAPGLPNITGSITSSGSDDHGFLWREKGNYQAVSFGAISTTRVYGGDLAGGVAVVGGYRLSIDASKSNTIYGSSSTVQPPAYKVYVYKRLTLGGGLVLLLLTLFLLLKGGKQYVSK